MTMKRILQCVLIGFLLIFASCKKDDTRVFSESADVRVQQALNNFQTTLGSATDGWIATIATKEGGGYSFWMQFDDQNRVKMLSDFDSVTTVDVSEASFRLKALQQPTLIFDTYSYIHLLADPNGRVNGGSNGTGLVSDFEFYLTDSALEKINKDPQSITDLNLIGRYNETVLKLKKATTAEKTAYLNRGLYSSIEQILLYQIDHPFVYLKDKAGKLYQVTADPATKKLTLTWVDEDKATYKSCDFAFSLYGMEVLDSLAFNEALISRITFDKKETKLVAQLDNGGIADVLVSDRPIIPAYVALGATFSTIDLPVGSNYAGWSSDFNSRFQKVKANFVATGRTIQNVDFVFNVDAKTMDFVVLYLSGTTLFNATFSYNYTMTNDGVFKFNLNTMNGNADLHEDKFDPILADRLNKDTFHLDYYVDDNNGILVSFTSVEHPEFVFTGISQ